MSFELHYIEKGPTDKPALILLHGFMGNSSDWDPMLTLLSNDYRCIAIDLPGHGKSSAIHVLEDDGFEETCRLIVEQLENSPYREFIFVGYSLGGRIAMYLNACFKLPENIVLRGLCIEGGNFGLLNAEEKHARLKNDIAWAERFEQQPIVDVLDDWYQQQVFSSLNPEQRQDLVVKRSDNLGKSIGMMLRSTSLAKQPHLLEALHRSTIPMLYICGEADKKFQHLAEQSQLTYQIIAQAGHNAHVEQPERFTHVLNTFLQQWK